ncbi:hypothetical protein EVAR_6349_1 [Eumeta japonica]|uniref:Uncharacterized protein n=1 Tax=Eumeta variegata TaxID=151549 RepID=A0A4C1TCB1_EUMVA|nr:hypothetical protein EVAR_6349_1 [Eumeta japonica]
MRIGIQQSGIPRSSGIQLNFKSCGILQYLVDPQCESTSISRCKFIQIAAFNLLNNAFYEQGCRSIFCFASELHAHTHLASFAPPHTPRHVSQLSIDSSSRHCRCNFILCDRKG